jgi:hypothetical protein
MGWFMERDKEGKGGMRATGYDYTVLPSTGSS